MTVVCCSRDWCLKGKAQYLNYIINIRENVPHKSETMASNSTIIYKFTFLRTFFCLNIFISLLQLTYKPKYIYANNTSYGIGTEAKGL